MWNRLAVRINGRIAGGGIDGFDQFRRDEMLDAIRRLMDVVFGVVQSSQIAFVGAMAMRYSGAGSSGWLGRQAA